MIQTGWANHAAEMEREITGIYRDAAREMYLRLADRDDSSANSGSPLASGHYSASMRIGIGAPDTSVEQVDTGYHYPSAARHKFSVWNLPPPTISRTPMSVVRNWLSGYRLGDVVYISNSTSYAVVIEDGRIGKNGSWQKPRGVFLPTLDGLFAQQGWY